MKHAKLYRMVTPEHICPFGTKSKFLLETNGFEVEDELLTNRAETDAFKQKYGVTTTPQTFIDGKRIGGYDDLRRFLNKKALTNAKGTSYTPVVALFTVSMLMAFSITWFATKTFDASSILRLFGGISMCVLAVQKLRDVEAFTNGFLNYDLLALRYVPYSYFYPFGELIAGLGMLSGVLPIGSGALAVCIGLEGSASVIKAVYIDKRELRCACMGGASNVPLGFISLTENLLMVAMGIWMFVI